MSIRPETVALLDRFFGQESVVEDQLYRIQTALEDLTSWSEAVRILASDQEPTDELAGALVSLRSAENEALEAFREASNEIIRLTGEK